MIETTAVLFANDVFYVAFAGRDMGAMDQVWAEQTPVACIHPGWNPIAGREEVMESWAAILGNEGSPPVQCRNAHATLIGDVAVVVCHEEIDDTFLIATNIFVKEDGRWKMIHHQAGPSLPPDEEDEESADLLQ